MAIIYTYPLMQQTVVVDDLLLMTDISDDKKTKSVKISALPFTNNTGTVTSVALTMPAAFAVANSPITTAGTLAVTPTGGASGQYLDYTGNWSTPPSGGNLPIEDEGSQITSAAAKINFTGAGVTASASGNDVTVNIPGGGGGYVLPLAANGTRGGIQIGYVQNAKNYPVVLSAEKAYVNVPWTDTNTTNITLTTSGTSGAATWDGTTLNIPQYSSGGGSGVSSFTNANGTYISAGTVNTNATGAVTVGTIDLSAVDGTAVAGTRFLSKDNTWDVPAYTVYNVASSSTNGLMRIASDTEQSVAANAVTSESGRTYGIQFNADDQAVVNVPWTDTTTSPAGSNTQIQYNNSGSFGATDLFTYSSRILSVGKVSDTSRSHLKVFGGGSQDAYLTLYCSAGTHGVTIEGPDHTGGSNYTLKLPASLPSVANQILESNASGTLSWIPTPSGGGSSKLGFTPLSIYEATGKIESVSGEEGSAFSIIRQSVCETDCTIDKVDFFRLAGTERVTVAVYTGTIAAGTGNLRLSGGQSSGTANQINTITFSSSYTFSAGDDIVILISLQYSNGNDAELLGATNLYSNSALGRENTTYYSSPAADFSTIIEDFSSASTKAGALHFYDE